MTEKSIKTLTVGGTKEGYNSWEFKIKSFLREPGCADALARVDMRAEVTDEKVKCRNNMANARIAMAMTMEDVVSSELVKTLVSSVYPDGDAALAWKALADRYGPRNAVDQQTMLTELFASKLDDGSKNPELWIIELQRMQTKLSGIGAIRTRQHVHGSHAGPKRRFWTSWRSV
jgi:hypothetical protein